jgi:hypothetical protein
VQLIATGWAFEAECSINRFNRQGGRYEHRIHRAGLRWSGAGDHPSQSDRGLKKSGLFVQPAIKASTDVMVASRKDTVKAKSAQSRGLKVLSYPEFISKFLAEAEIMSGGKPDRWCDAVGEVQVPDFTIGLDPAYIL